MAIDMFKKVNINIDMLKKDHIDMTESQLFVKFRRLVQKTNFCPIFFKGSLINIDIF